MADEPVVADQTPDVVPEPVVEAPPVVDFTPQVKIDTSGYDFAIEAQEDLRQYVSESDLPAIDARIADLKAKKAQAAASGEAEELAKYRRQAENASLAKILEGSGVKPESLTGNTPEERLASAKLVAEAVAPIKATLAELSAQATTGEPTQAQIDAHGEPMIPAGGQVGEDAIAKLKESVNTGDLVGTINNPAFKDRLKKLAGDVFG